MEYIIQLHSLLPLYLTDSHFALIGKFLADKITPVASVSVPATSHSFHLKEISEKEVREQLLTLKANKAIGLDNISARLLKCGALEITPSITKILNMSIRSGKFPGIWKCAKVAALFKSGDRTNATNYRPISILPTLSKIIERVVHSQLYEYLISNNLLSNNQFGFLNGQQQLHCLVSLMKSCLTWIMEIFVVPYF